ncbi:hypothetical protein F7725_006523 [Dissostichus mawsoni]|uniref:Uncharacterized protein n=1 Tax=Dissostichus mawsoni TaxID=36200 RepID=A0A7J5XUU1_DISMA|nr:hypothetical protein F7725_006523 [Dissostichus mawsoni]
MRNCLACGQPKSRYLGDGSSSKTVKYFYCSTKVFKTYAKEGLKDTRMSFENFAATPFFERELEAARQRGAEWRKVAEEREEEGSCAAANRPSLQVLSPTTEAGSQQPSYPCILPRGSREVYLLPLQSLLLIQCTGHGEGVDVAGVPAACKKYWQDVKPQWLEKLPKRFSKTEQAFLTLKKTVCKSVLDEMRRSGRSPEDISKVLHLKYERALPANVRDVKAGVYCQETITGYLRKADTPAPFGGKAEAHGWCGVSHYSHYLEELLTLLLQGTFGQALRSDHTRRGAGKVVLSSSTMSSYAIMNENWRILSWVTFSFTHESCIDELLVNHRVQHISRYVKHLAKLKNTSSSLNTSPEKVLETQQLWHSLTSGSQTISVPSKTVKYFYCSTKVFKTYAKEGLKDTRMSFENFAATPFFERELEAARQRGAEWRKVAEERGREGSSAAANRPSLQVLSPTTEAGSQQPSYPCILPRYIYCLSRVFSLYNAQGMEKELTWREFQLSDFYDAERDRWIADKRKT